MSTVLLDAAVPHHFCISVGNRDEALEWWAKIFGFSHEFSFEIEHINARGAFMRKGGMRLEIFEIAGSDPSPESRWKPNTDLRVQGTKHFCFAVNDVQSALEKVHAAGIQIVGVARSLADGMREEDDPSLKEGMLPAKAFFITDPWGCLVEVLSSGDFAM